MTCEGEGFEPGRVARSRGGEKKRDEGGGRRARDQDAKARVQEDVFVERQDAMIDEREV